MSLFLTLKISLSVGVLKSFKKFIVSNICRKRIIYGQLNTHSSLRQSSVAVNFTKKHQCWSLFFNKVTSLRSVPLLEQRLGHLRFPVSFKTFLRTHFYRTCLVAAIYASKETVILAYFKQYKAFLEITAVTL